MQSGMRGDRVLVQLRVSRGEHRRWRAAVGELAPSVAELIRLAVRDYLARRRPTARRTPLPWVVRRAARYVAELDGDRALAHEAIDLAVEPEERTRTDHDIVAERQAREGV
jgi:hypothetical protein